MKSMDNIAPPIDQRLQAIDSEVKELLETIGLSESLAIDVSIEVPSPVRRKQRSVARTAAATRNGFILKY